MDILHFKTLYEEHRLPPVQLWMGAMAMDDVEGYARILLPTLAYAKDNLSLHPNYFALSPLVDKKDITVDALSSLAAFLKTTPTLLGSRVVTIYKAESLNTHATNALLKVLEDVPAHTFFMLTTQTPRKLLPTLRSRCTIFTDSSPPLQKESSSPLNQHMGKLLLTLLSRGIPSFNAAVDDINDEEVPHLLNQVLSFVMAIIDYGQRTDQPPSPGMEKLYDLHERPHWVKGYLTIEDYLYHGVKSHLPPRDVLRGSFFLMQNPHFFTPID